MTSVRVLVGDRLVDMPEVQPGDRLLAVQATGDLLVVPKAEGEAVRTAVERAAAAFAQMARTPDDAVTDFFETFASRLADDDVWAAVAEANEADLASARDRGRATGRLEATPKMRDAMIDGLRGWAKMPSRRGDVIETRQADGWRIERRRAPLGVVAFVFEGRPNVFADGAGCLRGGNTSVMRIGSDALGTAVAIEENCITPALQKSGLPDGALTLVRSASHAAAHALFTHPQVRLAVARGSGRAVSLLGAIAAQHGIPVSLHGTGGAWMYVAPDARADVVRRAVRASVDRKVCNTLNVCVVARERAADLVPVVLEALEDRDPNYELHVAPEAEQFAGRGEPIPTEDLGREWEWDATPEVSLAVAGSDEEAVDLINRYSPRFVASIITDDPGRFEWFYENVDAPYVGNGFTRWVDGQWAWERPELGLTNWERGRLWGRSGILAGDDVYSVRDVWTDTTGEAPQHR